MSVPYCCITCKQPLQVRQDYYLCPECKVRYRRFAGVPNFKLGELYPGEEKVLEAIARQYEQADFVEMMQYADSRPEKNVLPWELRRSLRFEDKDEQGKKEWLANYTRDTIVEEGKSQLQVMQTLLKHAPQKPRPGVCLEIGCGRGPFSIAASTIFREVFALDIDMASVILAQKYCESQGIGNIKFFSASSSALPFSDDCFDLVNSQAVLEHVTDQLESLREIQRMLAPGGCFTGDSVNRYNLVTPEPHVDLRLIGFLPKSLAHKLSLALKNLPYDDIKPLSYFQLKAMLQEAFGTNYKIIPFIELEKMAGITQSVMKRLPRIFLKHFTHTHYILGIK